MVIVRKVNLFLIFLFFAAFSAGPAFSEPVGTMAKVEGAVDILKAGDTAPVTAREGDLVSPGDIVRTMRSGKAEIRFNDDSVIQVAPESRIRVDDYVVNQSNVRKTGLLSLFRGKVRALVSKSKDVIQTKNAADANFKIKTRTAIAGVKGSDLTVSYHRGVTLVFFMRGHGFVVNPVHPAAIVPLGAGQMSYVLQGNSTPSPARTITAGQANVLLNSIGAAPSGGGSSGNAGTVPGPAAVSVVADTMSVPGLLSQTPGMPIPAPVFQADAFPVLLPNQPPVIPITETHPDLLGTKVTVNVAIPR